MKSFMASPATIERKWYVVDATGYTLGRLASEVAKVLRGKNKPIFTPHMDCGDYVIIVNAEHVKVTGKKLDQKIYYNHSDYVGGMKETTLREMMAKKPEKVVELAVKGMLPKGPLGRSMLNKLHVYARLASEVAKVLRGKNKPIFTPHMDCGDYVIIVNAEHVKVTGKKLDQKIYYNHSDYVGGMKETTLREMMAKKPEKVVELAVKGMLPKGPLGRSMLNKLHVYAGPDHQQAAQKPEVLTF